MAKTLVDICAYAGTGNVLKIQSLLHICSEHYEPAEPSSKDDKKDKKKVNLFVTALKFFNFIH